MSFEQAGTYAAKATLCKESKFKTLLTDLKMFLLYVPMNGLEKAQGKSKQDALGVLKRRNVMAAGVKTAVKQILAKSCCNIALATFEIGGNFFILMLLL